MQVVDLGGNPRKYWQGNGEIRQEGSQGSFCCQLPYSCGQMEADLAGKIWELVYNMYLDSSAPTYQG